MLVLVMYTFDKENYQEILMSKQEESEEPKEPKEKKKKKKGAKNDEVSILAKFVENINIKIFEEKYETIPEQLWAKSTCDQYVFHALPGPCNKKIFSRLDFKKTQQFYTKFYNQIKDLMNIGKTSGSMNSRQLVQNLD